MESAKEDFIYGVELLKKIICSGENAFCLSYNDQGICVWWMKEETYEKNVQSDQWNL